MSVKYFKITGKIRKPKFWPKHTKQLLLAYMDIHKFGWVSLECESENCKIFMWYIAQQQTSTMNIQVYYQVTVLYKIYIITEINMNI
jgi:hypothetical protein